MAGAPQQAGYLTRLCDMYLEKVREVDGIPQHHYEAEQYQEWARRATAVQGYWFQTPEPHAWIRDQLDVWRRLAVSGDPIAIRAAIGDVQEEVAWMSEFGSWTELVACEPEVAIATGTRDGGQRQQPTSWFDYQLVRRWNRVPGALHRRQEFLRAICKDIADSPGDRDI